MVRIRVLAAGAGKSQRRTRPGTAGHDGVALTLFLACELAWCRKSSLRKAARDGSDGSRREQRAGGGRAGCGV